MANGSQLAMLTHSVAEWNQWRAASAPKAFIAPRPNDELVRPIDLTGADLDRIDLTGANLSEVDLRNADLSRSKLRRADFRGADLRGAKLRASDLIHADFSTSLIVVDDASDMAWPADLRRASFRDAALLNTKFHDALVESTDFGGAILCGTELVRIDLAELRGLDTCAHSGPSTIDFATLITSPNLPVEFLRGCGVPERLVNWLVSLGE
jgi:uncharacterized protein YjbI with pentapeptide repeats